MGVPRPHTCDGPVRLNFADIAVFFCQEQKQEEGEERVEEQGGKREEAQECRGGGGGGGRGHMMAVRHLCGYFDRDLEMTTSW